MIRRNPGKHQQIESFRQMFFNDMNLAELGGVQVLLMNQDEQRFFKKMMVNYQDIITLFPALYKL